MSSSTEVSLASYDARIARALDSEMDIKKDDEKNNKLAVPMSLTTTAHIHT